MAVSAQTIRDDAKRIAQSLLDYAVEKGNMRDSIRILRTHYAEDMNFESVGYFTVCLQYLAGRTNMKLNFRDKDEAFVEISSEMIDFLAEH